MSRFSVPPRDYDLWYETPLGMECDRAEKELICSYLPPPPPPLPPSIPPTPPAPGLCLDVGCGTGNYTLLLIEKGLKAVGIDSSFENISYLKEKASKRGLRPYLVVGKAEDLPFKAGAFDTVVEVTALCFVEDLGSALSEANRVLKRSGVFVLGELNRKSYWALLRRIKGAFKKSVYRGARFFKIRKLCKRLRKAGFTPVEHSTAVWFPPVNSAPLLRLAGVFESAGRRLLPGQGAFLAIKAIK